MNKEKFHKYIELYEYFNNKQVSYSDYFTKEIEGNAIDLLYRVNALLACLDLLPVRVTSGWRPEPYNKRIGGASKSYHIKGKAIDISDPKGLAYEIIAQNYELLDDFGLWMYQGNKFIHLDTGIREAREKRIFTV